MSIRTEENLFDRLADDIIWRKRELSILRWLLNKATPDRRDPLLRVTVALVYAHWEGYVKTASASYMEFLHYRRLRFVDLAPNFIAIAARAILRRGSASDKLAAHLDITNFYLNGLEEECRLPYKTGVDTGSNLSSAVLKEIVYMLGLDYGPFETKAHLIDERLLRARNTIAHGEYLVIDTDSVGEIAGEVLAMLEAFRAQIDNAVALQSYRSRRPVDVSMESMRKSRPNASDC